MTAVHLPLITIVPTSLSGLCALTFRDRLPLVLGFTAGVLSTVVAFDLLPEVFALSARQ
jgi:hypothetical protein